MENKHIPLRKCIGCGVKNPKEKFMMVVRPSEDENKQIYADVGKNKKSGRAAYICFDLECLKKARKVRRMERIFSCKIESEIYDALERMAQKNEK